MGKYYEKLKAYIWKDNRDEDYEDEKENYKEEETSWGKSC